MHQLEPQTMQLIRSLQDAGVDPILYGSQGAAVYLGKFKKFSDIDLLVDDRWLKDGWEELQSVMDGLGYKMIDLHEHEFSDTNGQSAAFASSSILIRDNIAASINDAITTHEISGNQITTLTPEAFLAAYKYSAKDGYRKDTRGKKDTEVIALLEDYLNTHSN